MAYQGNQITPSFQAYCSNNSQTNVTGNGAQYTIIFDTVVYDTTTSYNASNGVYTAPVSGKYLFLSNAQLSGVTSSTNQSTFVLITPSGSYYSNLTNPYVNSQGGYWITTLSFVVFMNKNDTANIQVTVFNGSSDSLGIAGYSRGIFTTTFSGQLLS